MYRHHTVTNMFHSNEKNMCSSDANKRMKHHKINLTSQIFSLIYVLSKTWTILIGCTCEGRYCELKMIKCWRYDDSRLNMTSSARICALQSAHLHALNCEWIVQPSLSSTRMHCSDIWERLDWTQRLRKVRLSQQFNFQLFEICIWSWAYTSKRRCWFLVYHLLFFCLTPTFKHYQ
jgi:hypothetical protein